MACRINRLTLIALVCLGFYFVTGPLYYAVKTNWGGVLYVKNIFTAKKYDSNYPTSTAFRYSSDPASTLALTDTLPRLTTSCPLQSLADTPMEPEFGYDDTDLVAEIGSSFACLPKNFGYSKSDGEEVFPWKAYPTCESQVKDPYPMIHLDLDHNLLYMNCSSSAKGRYLLGPTDSRKFTMRREVEDIWQVRDYTGKPARIEPWHEFALGTCSDEAFFDQATYLLRPNATAALYAKNRTQQLQAETGVTRKPLIVFLLVVDSYSRRHFFRKMPETLEFLNTLNQQKEYRVFDFKMHNTIGGNSVANQVPILTSKD